MNLREWDLVIYVNEWVSKISTLEGAVQQGSLFRYWSTVKIKFKVNFNCIFAHFEKRKHTYSITEIIHINTETWLYKDKVKTNKSIKMRLYIIIWGGELQKRNLHVIIKSKKTDLQVSIYSLKHHKLVV